MQIVIIVVDTVISIHALLAESDVVHIAEHASPGGISIHALLAESDLVKLVSNSNITSNFYPRSPCGERPFSSCIPNRRLKISIHALLAESDHPKMSDHPHNTKFLSTLSLRRATLQQQYSSSDSWHFYPRSPCGERLWYSSASSWLRIYFYPRSPCGERRRPDEPSGEEPEISIHALLAESDGLCQSWLYSHHEFLSTLSLRRATLFLQSLPNTTR